MILWSKRKDEEYRSDECIAESWESSAQGAEVLHGAFQWLKPLATIVRRGGEEARAG